MLTVEKRLLNLQGSNTLQQADHQHHAMIIIAIIANLSATVAAANGM